MIRVTLLLASFAVFLLGGFARADILMLIEAGKLDEARDSISAASSTFSEQPNLFFFRGLLEPNADSSASLLKRALDGDVSRSYQEVIVIRLAAYNLSKGSMDDAMELAAEYLERWPDGKYGTQATRMLILGLELDDQADSAVQMTDIYLTKFPKGEPAQWGFIDKTRLALRQDASLIDSKLLRKLTQPSAGVVSPVGLELAVLASAKLGRTNEAVRYFGTLKESYPHAIGLTSVTEQIADLPDDTTRDIQAEKITGTYYSVRVGIFAQKQNADQQATRCAGDSLVVTLDTKQVSGKLYYVVYVGRFRTFADAEKVKTRLEALTGETYQVAAR